MELGSTEATSVTTAHPSFPSNLCEVPRDESDKILVRRRNKAKGKEGDEHDGVENVVCGLEGICVIRISGYFNFVNYESMLRKMKKMLGDAEGKEVGIKKFNSL